MFDRIVRRLHEAGYESAMVNYFIAGKYYDGEQHGKSFPCVFVNVWKRDAGYNRGAVEKAIRYAMRGTTGLTVLDWSFGDVYAFRIAEQSAIDEAHTLDAIAEAYLEAFWQTIHNDPTARDNNAEKAVRAGHLAIDALRCA